MMQTVAEEDCCSYQQDRENEKTNQLNYMTFDHVYFTYGHGWVD